MPVFKADFSLAELTNHPKKPPDAIFGKLQETEHWSPQVLSGCWVDSNNVIFAVYCSLGEHPEPGNKRTNKDQKVRLILSYGSVLQNKSSCKSVPVFNKEICQKKQKWELRTKRWDTLQSKLTLMHLFCRMNLLIKSVPILGKELPQKSRKKGRKSNSSSISALPSP